MTRQYIKSPKIRKLTKLEVAYLAGLVDGEGCLGLAVRLKKYVTPTLQIGNTNYDIIEWLMGITGTCYYVPDKRPNRKQAYLWRCAGAQAREVIRFVYPFLIIKKKQAKVILDLHDRIGVGYGQGNGRKLSDNDFEMMAKARKKISVLNGHGGKKNAIL